MRESTKAAVDNITLCMAGDEGCVRFVRLLGLLEEIDGRAERDPRAAEVIDIVMKFSTLIDLANERS